MQAIACVPPDPRPLNGQQQFAPAWPPKSRGPYELFALEAAHELHDLFNPDYNAKAGLSVPHQERICLVDSAGRNEQESLRCNGRCAAGGAGATRRGIAQEASVENVLTKGPGRRVGHGQASLCTIGSHYRGKG
ncbi:hypothetical protein ACVWYQ_003657 [Bradyrhizobium sp. USDA 3397]